MANAGRILILPKGDYDASATYEMLDLVNYGGTSWLAKKTVTSIEPSKTNNEYWQEMFNLSSYDEDTFTHEYISGDVIFRKRNGIVTASCYHGWNAGVPVGDLGVLFVIPEKYRPISNITTMCYPTSSGTHIQIEIQPDGDFKAYNYGGEITELRTGRFSIAYLSAY